jgi:hypothetical protein
VTAIDRSRGDVGLPAHHTTVHLEWFERVSVDKRRAQGDAIGPCAWSEAGFSRVMRIHSSRRRPMAAERSGRPFRLSQDILEAVGTYGLENVLREAERSDLLRITIRGFVFLYPGPFPAEYLIRRN